MAKLFKGFKQVMLQEGMTLENGYLYLVRTNDTKTDGYLYLNGKKYGTAEDVKTSLLGEVEANDAKTFAAVNIAINELARVVGDENNGLVEEVNALRAELNALGGIEGGDGIGGMIDAKIEALKLPETYEQKGAAAQALTEAKTYTDEKTHIHENKEIIDTITTEKIAAWDGAETAAKEYADGLAANYDAAGAAATAETNAKAYTDELANGAVKTNTEAIATLNGTGEGSVDKKVADAIAEVVANAPENLDTLKEIADYISSNPEGVAELTNKVTGLEGKAHTHENKEIIDTITTEKIAAWDGAETAAKAYADGLATNYDAAGAAATAETNAKAHADGLNTAMNTRVEELEGVSHEHTNKAELDLIQAGDVAKWNAVITVEGDDVD